MHGDTAPGSAVDFDYLESYAGGDMQVVREVLAMFRTQAETWRAQLDAPDRGWRDLTHTMKGSALGIGARTLGQTCARAEQGDASLAPEVRAALDEAVAEIDGYLSRVGGG